MLKYHREIGSELSPRGIAGFQSMFFNMSASVAAAAAAAPMSRQSFFVSPQHTFHHGNASSTDHCGQSRQPQHQSLSAHRHSAATSSLSSSRATLAGSPSSMTSYSDHRLDDGLGSPCGSLAGDVCAASSRKDGGSLSPGRSVDSLWLATETSGETNLITHFHFVLHLSLCLDRFTVKFAEFFKLIETMFRTCCDFTNKFCFYVYI